MVELLPGDVAFQIAAARHDIERVTPAVRNDVYRELGLDRSAMVRLAEWGWTVAQGDLGRSNVSGEAVAAPLSAALFRTLQLVAIAWPTSVLLGLLFGFLLSGSTRRLAIAKLLGALSSGAPAYVIGLTLVSLFAIQWRLLPAAGYGGLIYLVLPSATLAVRSAARIALIVATSLSSAGGHPSVSFARMKGLGELEVTLKHVFPLAAPPIVAFAFVGLASQLTGVVIIEQVFAYPGLGKLLVDSVVARDVPMIQAIAILLAVLIVSCNTLAESSARFLSLSSGR
ncbi:MAG: ABC transporter permease [Beijerinckiaceae bacterium]|nr:ABC transporter permease [Beijerinckiaceae bacterium]